MGIPGLTTRMKPFATPISWQEQKNNDHPSSPEHLIIDGPSLAYYIYHRCLAHHASASSALDAIPTYQELGEATIAWLEKIETFGLRVKHIFFDGHLPQSKIDTRYSRLAKLLLQLRTYRSFHKTLDAREENVSPSENASWTFRAPSRITTIPAAGFLVPAILDALRESSYNDVTQATPCEAEAHCTNNSILKEGSIILTNDSDMILLAGSNRVMSLNDMDIRPDEDLIDTLHGSVHSGASLSTTLDCPDLMKLAFLLTRESHSELASLARQVRENNVTFSEQEFQKFKDAFLPDHQYSAFAWASEDSSPLSRVLTQLDPRISEFVQQWGVFALPATSPPAFNPAREGGSKPLRMFLPFLIDDPSRASAWLFSASVRKLAYSILAGQGRQCDVVEIDRRGERIVDMPLFLFCGPLAVTTACKEFLDQLPMLEEVEDQMAVADRWKVFATSQVLATMTEEGTTLPLKTSVLQVLYGMRAGFGWEHVHFSAQVAAYVYSLRILCQFLEVYTKTCLAQDTEMIVFHRLCHRLRRLPPLSKILTCAGGGLRVAPMTKEVQPMFEKHYVRREVDEKIEKLPRKQQMKRRRKEEKGERAAGSERKKAVTQASSNMFSLLGDDA